MKDRAQRWRFLAVAMSAAWLLASFAPPAAALDPLPAPASAYRVQGFWPGATAWDGPSVDISVEPSLPNGYYGWYVSIPRVSLSTPRPAAIRYSLNDPTRGWRPYLSPLIIPEGKHVLYAQATAPDGSRGPVTALPVKVDLRSRAVENRTSGPNERKTAGTVAVTGQNSVSGVVNVTASAKPWAGPRVIRVYGPDRYGTCEQIATTDFGTASVVVLARGDDFPDALSAAALAGIYNAPIVLTRTNEMPSVISDALTRMGTRSVFVIGSTRAVSSAVEEGLESRGFGVERFGGADRYETAALVARAVVRQGGQQGKAFVARGDLYPDSLAVSPFAYVAKRPILLVRPTSLPAATELALRDLGITEVVIAGSDRAVSLDVEQDIARVASIRTDRAEGADRYGTAVAAARYGVAQGLGGFGFVGIATGQNFPDALCGGAAAGHVRGVVLMTPKAALSPATAAELRTNGPVLRDIQVFGSEIAVSKAVWDELLETVR